MNATDLLMSRTGRVARTIALEVMSMRQGGRLPPVQVLASKTGVGNGTVAAALETLEAANAIVLEAKGRLGTYVQKIDYALLWQLSGSSSFSVALPLPYTLRYEAMATALQESFLNAKLPISLIFIRGANERAKAVREGRADAAVVSAFAANHLFDLVTVTNFGMYTYVSGHGIIIKKGKTVEDSNLRLAVDQSSIDQAELSRKYFPEVSESQIVTVSYHKLYELIEIGEIDAAVWNMDELSKFISPNVEVMRLPETTSQDNTAATLIAAPKGRGSTAVVEDIVSDKRLLETFNEVLSGSRRPTY